MPGLYVGEAGIRAVDFVASEEGRALLDARPDLSAALAQFSLAGIDEKPEDIMNPTRGTGWKFVYTGALTETRALDDVAVESSTFTTGRRRWEQGYPTADRFKGPDWRKSGAAAFGTAVPATPEGLRAVLDKIPATRQRRYPRVDMLDQSTYLRALGSLVGTSTNEELFVPGQLFALTTPSGDSLAASSHVPGWMTLSEWLMVHGDPSGNALGIRFDGDKTVRQVADRVRAAVGNSALRHGLDDLLLGGTGRYYGDTIIVPENITSPRGSQLGIARMSPVRRSRTYRKAIGAAARLAQ